MWWFKLKLMFWMGLIAIGGGSRPMSELTRMGGETAMIWFDSVLPSEEPTTAAEEEGGE